MNNNVLQSCNKNPANWPTTTAITRSVTRLGNFLNFGQIFKAFGNN